MSELDKLKSMQHVDWSVKNGICGVTVSTSSHDSQNGKARSDDEEDMIRLMKLMQLPKFREDLAALVDKTMENFVRKNWKYLSFVSVIVAGLVLYIFQETKSNLADLSVSVSRLGNEISALGAAVQGVEKQVDRTQQKAEKLEERLYMRGSR